WATPSSCRPTSPLSPCAAAAHRATSRSATARTASAASRRQRHCKDQELRKDEEGVHYGRVLGAKGAIGVTEAPRGNKAAGRGGPGGAAAAGRPAVAGEDDSIG